MGQMTPQTSGDAHAGRAVEAGQAWAWITGGFELFKKQPGLWIAITVVSLVVVVVLVFIPFLGGIAIALLMPIFAGGLMLGCQAQQRGGLLEFNHLFAGFKEQVGSLITLGALNIVAGIVVMIPILLIVGAGVLFGASTGGNASGIAALGMTAVFAGLIFFVSVLLVAMAFIFAPALVVLRGLAPVDAIKQSFTACLKNIVPLLIYSIIMMVFGLLAGIPLGLGWLVLSPVTIASVYVAYRDIYGDS